MPRTGPLSGSISQPALEVKRRSMETKKSTYEVVVGNIGVVHSSKSHLQAESAFHDYVALSKRTNSGKVSRQPVTITKDGRPDIEYAGTMDEPEMDSDPMAGLKGLTTAISKVVEYNWDKEKDDFRDNEESRPLHIFRYLVHLDNFLGGTDATPESYL